MERYFGHLGGVLVILEHYSGKLEFWYYDNVEIAFSPLLEVLQLVVQLRHDAEHLLLRLVRHVHKVRL